jgi:hypothetical protein
VSSEHVKRYHSAGSAAQQPHHPCPQQPGTVLRIYIPPGAVINLLNILEISTPAGICLIVRIPLFQGGGPSAIQSMIESIKQAGGTVEVLKS